MDLKGALRGLPVGGTIENKKWFSMPPLLEERFGVKPEPDIEYLCAIVIARTSETGYLAWHELVATRNTAGMETPVGTRVPFALSNPDD